MKSGVEVPFRRCPKGGNPAFLDDQSQNGPLESEILESRSRSRSRLIEAQIPANFPIPAKSGFPDFPKSRPNRDRGKIPNSNDGTAQTARDLGTVAIEGWLGGAYTLGILSKGEEEFNSNSACST